MRILRPRRYVNAVALPGALFLVFALAPVAMGSMEAVAPSGQRQAAFVAAARESSVPLSVLMAVSYRLTRWESHAGQQSTGGGFGPMHLTEVVLAQRQGRDPQSGGLRLVPDSPALHTLSAAARLLHASTESLRSGDAANIRGGAALLADYARQRNDGALPGSTGQWYAAVATYANPNDPTEGHDFADAVFASVASGASRTTDDGQRLTSPPEPSVRANTASLPAPRKSAVPAPECPIDLSCSYVPAYYGPRGGPGNPDKSDFCNYDIAKRPQDVAIHDVVMHDTEETYADTLRLTQGNTYCASFPYLIRSSDGHVTQTVPTSVVAWHAGNYWVNMHSLGIEEEGFLVRGPTWYSEPLYQSAAKLLRYLSTRFGIPLDRGHILGHDTVPGPSDRSMPGMHADPGVAYDWSHLFNLAGAPIPSAAMLPTYATSSPTDG